MTEADVIAHWRKGARNELESAKLLRKGGQYAASLFHCHLAIEKALKVLYTQEKSGEAPLTHDLLQIALQLKRVWTELDQPGRYPPLLPSSMNRKEGLRLAKEFKELLLKQGYPVHRVVLYGSVAKGTARADSDIDIAVIMDAFHSSRIREGGDILLASKSIDLRIETVTLHPDDFSRPFFSLAREIERTGVEV